ncbi:hypothetical protein [Paenibacillus piri]|uniref:Uncharacterized protein n=1 Tax=Paenibacillus piri TaxID=2547395 RepID=A0A4R5KP20_9BACL|nr:hypothetical protein [Paenibacillus piri]TDF96360.1 hypothetical protein E1757_18460 [Paenibacillus piri]
MQCVRDVGGLHAGKTVQGRPRQGERPGSGGITASVDIRAGDRRVKQGRRQSQRVATTVCPVRRVRGARWLTVGAAGRTAWIRRDIGIDR